MTGMKEKPMKPSRRIDDIKFCQTESARLLDLMVRRSTELLVLIERMREGLELYGEHRAHCGWDTSNPLVKSDACTCGLDGLLKEKI